MFNNGCHAVHDGGGQGLGDYFLYLGINVCASNEIQDKKTNLEKKYLIYYYFWDWGNSVVEFLPSVYKALVSIPSTVKKEILLPFTFEIQ
jgi:hypothetical protein